jgi:ankyrin repeat protein
VDQQRQYCLHKACAAGDLDTVKRLINEGASINGADTHLHSAPLYHALRGHSITNIDGVIPVSRWCPSLDVARYLIEHGADVNLARRIDGTSSLLINFCETGSIEAVEFLLAHGAEANVAALTYACRSHWRSVELCQLLLDHGVPVDPPRSWLLDTPLWYLCLLRTSSPENVPLAAFLLDRGADINRMKSKPNGRPQAGYLGVACSTCDVAMAQLLLDRGADADHVFQGKTLLQHARFRAINDAQIHPPYRKDWAALIAVLEAAPPTRVRSRTHWRRRILFHVIGRRANNPRSKRHELGLYRVSDIASFLLPGE